MEIVYSKTKTGNKCIIYDGFMYRKVRVNRNGTIFYRCSIGKSCSAMIIVDAEGTNIVKMNTNHWHSEHWESDRPKLNAQSATSSVVWNGERAVKITHTETKFGNKSIIYDGFKYREMHVSQKTGNTTYICCGFHNCYASIIIDGEGKNVVKLNNNHHELCYERKVKLQSDLHVTCTCKEKTDNKTIQRCNEQKAKRRSKPQAKKLSKVNDRSPSKTFPASTACHLQQTGSSIIWNGEHAMEITHSKTRNGTKSIIHEGFVYRMVHVSQNGHISYRCSIEKSCNAMMVVAADGENVVKLRLTHSERCYKRRTITSRKQSSRRRKLSNTRRRSKTFPDSTNVANQALAAAVSNAPSCVASAVTPVPSPSVVSRQHEDDEIPMTTETFDYAMPVPLMFIKTELDVSSTIKEELVEQEIDSGDGIRRKKANEEAQKLSQMPKDLGKLDNSSAADVTLNRIENASRQYTEAQERYNKAEREFNDAKLILQQKSELKAQLTEYLNTVIQQNQIRKACKLQEIMSELEIQSPSSEAVPLTFLPLQSSFGVHDINSFHSPLTSPESSTSRVPFVPYSSQSTDEPASSLLQSASSDTDQFSIVPQITFSDPPPSSSVPQPDSSVPYPVSLCVASQMGIRHEHFVTVNRMDTSSPISIHSDSSSEET